MGMKEIYQDKADAQLHEWQEWIENYKTDPGISGTRGPADHQLLSERLEDCQRIARIRLQELRSSHDEHWELAKQAVERAMIDLKRVLDESGVEQTGRSLHLQSSRAHVYEPYFRKG